MGLVRLIRAQDLKAICLIAKGIYQTKSLFKEFGLNQRNFLFKILIQSNF